LYQVLLQWIDAEGVFDLEGGRSAVRSVGLNKKFAVFAEEPGMHAIIIEANVIEITKHGLVVRMLHRESVLRSLPHIGFGLVAAHAAFAADESLSRVIACGVGPETAAQTSWEKLK
jgi:hypothetical protein